MIIGFTGTSEGMTPIQYSELYRLIKVPIKFIGEAHHGDCIGADAQFHEICLQVGIGPERIHIHPGNLPNKRAYCKSEHIYPTKENLKRNWDIVNNCTYLIACPNSFEEKLRSGTWATIRYARKTEYKPMITIIYPDGSKSKE